jgi:hypothetical protein
MRAHRGRSGRPQRGLSVEGPDTPSIIDSWAVDLDQGVRVFWKYRYPVERPLGLLGEPSTTEAQSFG